MIIEYCIIAITVITFIVVGSTITIIQSDRCALLGKARVETRAF
jgi:hypothetical protein